MKFNQIVLSQIADEAAKKDKRALAKKLLENENSLTRKIPVLVRMQEHESSLEAAFNGKDTNLINLVLIKFFDNSNEADRLSLYKKVLQLPAELGYQLLAFLKKTCKTEYLAEFLKVAKNSEIGLSEQFANAAIPISQHPDAGQRKALELFRGKVVEIKRCKDIADAMKDKDTSALLENELKVIEYHMKDAKSAEETADSYKVSFL